MPMMGALIVSRVQTEFREHQLSYQCHVNNLYAHNHNTWVENEFGV
jgi:hypothetical protein